ncbi:MAG TPA: glycosyltransferase family 4 protein, partial [Phnomibacter sp.]|nr:glycosyltransferase family 4 protein [Phnomibacter sp.]
EEAIKSLASQDSRIELTGFVSGQQKQELLQHAAFTLLPSEWLENNPISLIESLAAGIPVIGSNRGGIPEMVVNGKSGFIFNHDEPGSIENMLAGISTLSPAHWEQLSVNARRHYEENYTPDIHFSNLMAFYHNTLKRES